MTSLNYILARKLLKTKNKKQNGFTLIELMVVVAIIGVLTAVGLPKLNEAQNAAKDAAAKAEVVNAAKTCSVDSLTGTTSYVAADYPLVGGTCGADETLTGTSATGETFAVTLVGGVPGAPK